MNLALWIVTGVLCAFFTVSGVAKSTMSMEQMVETGQTGVANFPLPVVRVTALLELAAVVGLVAPWWSDRWPALTPSAGVGLVLVMCGAAISHAALREPKAVTANLVLLLMAAFVAAGRFAQLA